MSHRKRLFDVWHSLAQSMLLLAFFAFLFFMAYEKDTDASDYDKTGPLQDRTMAYLCKQVAGVYKIVALLIPLFVATLSPIVSALRRSHERVLRLESELEALKRTIVRTDSDQMRHSEGITLHQQT